MSETAMKLIVVMHEADEGGYWVEVPCLKGCYSEGDTLQEAKANIAEAIEGALAVRRERVENGEVSRFLSIPEDLKFNGNSEDSKYAWAALHNFWQICGSEEGASAHLPSSMLSEEYEEVLV